MTEPLTGLDEARFSADKHWLMMDRLHNERGAVTGCRCGFNADPEDFGFGDSVVEHIAAAVRADERAKVLAEVEDALNSELLNTTRRYIGSTDAAMGYVDGLHDAIEAVRALGTKP